MALSEHEPIVAAPPTSGAKHRLEIPAAGPLTYDDLRGFPDSGHRFELIRGTLIVTPGPAFGHQNAQTRLLFILDRLLPAGVVVLPAPFDWRIADDTLFQPDLVVIPDDLDIRVNKVTDPPTLAVEILSPSTKHYDRGLKMLAYAEFGLEHFWLVDPIEPRVQAHRRRPDGSGFDLVAEAGAGERFSAAAPFPVEFAVDDLHKRRG